MGPAILPSSWVIYDEVNQSNGLDFCKGCTLISSFALLVFGGSPSKGLVLESLSKNAVTMLFVNVNSTFMSNLNTDFANVVI